MTIILTLTLLLAVNHKWAGIDPYNPAGGPSWLWASVPIAEAQRGGHGSSDEDDGDRQGRAAAAQDRSAGPTGAAERGCRRAGRFDNAGMKARLATEGNPLPFQKAPSPGGLLLQTKIRPPDLRRV
jgi:hypothetical protein